MLEEQVQRIKDEDERKGTLIDNQSATLKKMRQDCEENANKAAAVEQLHDRVKKYRGGIDKRDDIIEKKTAK